MTSPALPAAKGTIVVMVLVGHAWAKAGPALARATSEPAIIDKVRHRALPSDHVNCHHTLLVCRYFPIDETTSVKDHSRPENEGKREYALTLSVIPMARVAQDWESRIGRRVTLRDLHILSAVVRWGSMAKAASHLAMSQSAVSEAVANLEDAFAFVCSIAVRRVSSPRFTPTPCSNADTRCSMNCSRESRTSSSCRIPRPEKCGSPVRISYRRGYCRPSLSDCRTTILKSLSVLSNTSPRH